MLAVKTAKEKTAKKYIFAKFLKEWKTL